MQHSQVEKNMLPALMATPPQKCQWPSISCSSSSCPTPSNPGTDSSNQAQASHMSEGRLAGLKTLLTKHVPMGISQRVYFTGIIYFHLFVPFLLFGFFFFLILPPWAGHRKSLISFPLLCWHRFWSQCRGWRDACCFQWEEGQAQSCRCYSCKYSAPPFISHIAPCSTT